MRSVSQPRMSVDPLELARVGSGRPGRVAGGRRGARPRAGTADPRRRCGGRRGAARGGAAIVAAARAAGQRAACFALSEEFGAWRVVGARRALGRSTWSGCAGGRSQADLALRDFTVNAIAEPLAGGEPIDPLGGRARSARRAGCGSPARAHSRTTRCACCGWCAWPSSSASEPDAANAEPARAQAARLRGSRPSECSWSCSRIIACDRAVAGLVMAEEVGAAAVVLPELGGPARASSRAATTTTTSTATRWRCWSGLLRSSVAQPDAADPDAHSRGGRRPPSATRRWAPSANRCWPRWGRRTPPR